MWFEIQNMELGGQLRAPKKQRRQQNSQRWVQYHIYYSSNNKVFCINFIVVISGLYRQHRKLLECGFTIRMIHHVRTHT